MAQAPGNREHVHAKIDQLAGMRMSPSMKRDMWELEQSHEAGPLRRHGVQGPVVQKLPVAGSSRADVRGRASVASFL